MRWTLLVAVLMLCACGERGASNAAVEGDSAAAAAPTTEVVLVTVDDTSLVLSMDIVPAGPVSFLVSNRADTRHSLRIQSVADSWNVSNILGGQDATLLVDLSPGIYELFCPDLDADGSHASRGLYARLVVTE